MSSFKSTAMACLLSATALIATSSAPSWAAASAAAAPADTQSAGDRDAKIQRDVAAAEAKIRGNKATLDAFMKAVQANDSDQVKAMLVKNGVPEKEVSKSRLFLKDRTGGVAARDVIVIGFCCPLVIIIIIFA